MIIFHQWSSYIKVVLHQWPPVMGDDPWLRMAFDGRWHLMKDCIWWKTTFDGRDNIWLNKLYFAKLFWWKLTFDGRQPLIELTWRSFDRIWALMEALMEDDLRRKTTSYGRIPLMMVDGLWWKKTFHGSKTILYQNLFSVVNVFTQIIQWFLPSSAKPQSSWAE